jgi:broad specificity phosphatase PhoE
MILKKEFYFVRHGQTDYNNPLIKTDPGDFSLNATGRMQALNLAPLINQLSFHTICCSPLKRAKETKELLIPDREHQEIHDLRECTAEIWNTMTSLGKDALSKGSSSIKDFLEQAKNGLNQALKHPGPVLIIAHGGIHWAMCYWMNIEDHDWIIDNCKPVHFSISQNPDRWIARLL